MKKRYAAVAMALCISLTLLPPAAFAADEGEESTAAETYSDVADIIGPSHPDTGGEEMPEEEVILPNTEDLHANADFRPYDPYYPQKAQYGDYTLQVPKLKGRLTFSGGKGKQVIGTLFAPGTSRDGGWKDATKRWGDVDSNLCFAASSSNLISWYLEQYQQLHPQDETAFVTAEESVFDFFRDGWINDGGDQKDALSWYFTGGFPGGRGQADKYLNGRQPGGYLSGKIPHNTSDRWSMVSLNWHPAEVFEVYGGYEDNDFPYLEELSGHSGNGPISTLEGFSEQILRQLHYGACAISIIKDSGIGGAGHSITLWGVDYDVATGLVTGIYVTDSDDRTGLFRVAVEAGPGNRDGVRLIKYPYHGPGNDTPYTKIRGSVLLYAPNVVGQNQSYNGPDAVIDGIVPNADKTAVEVRVSNITDRTLEYGYSFDRNGNNVVRWQTDSYFYGLAPDQYYFFARVKGENGENAGGLSAPFSYRIEMPSPISQEMVPSLSLGTEFFHPYRQTPQYIWYGTESGPDDRGPEAPILWRVLDNKTNTDGEGLFLLSDRLFGSGNSGEHFSDRAPYENTYQGSNVWRWCRNFENRMTLQEQMAMLPTTKSDEAYDSHSNGGVMFGAQAGILSFDKVFLPSAEEILTTLDTAQSRQGWYRGGYDKYWLRSPVEQETGYAGYVDSDGYVGSRGAYQECAVRPAFNLDSSRVLYAAAVGNGQFSDFTGMEKIRTVQSCDFRLVLTDTGRAFQVTTPELNGQAGGAVTLSYIGAETSQSHSEYISAILLDPAGKPAYYGKIAAVQSADGEVRFVLPGDLRDGVYTLKVFNEQYNGEMVSGVASEFCDVRLTIDGQVPVEPIKEVQITVPAPVTGQKPQNAVVAGSACAVLETTWTPNHAVFQANTHYDVSVTVKAALNHGITPATVFTLNGKVVAPVVHGEECTVTYADFPKTTDDSSGGGSSSSGGSSSGGGSSSESTNTEITDGPNGSKIETVIRPDGTKVETTKFPNGDKFVTETKKDGSVTTNTEKADGTVAKTSADKNGYTKAEVMVSEKAEREAKETGKPLELPIPAMKAGSNPQNAPVIKVETESGKNAKVTIPVSPLTYHTVAMIVHEDGTEEVVRKSVNTKTGVTLSVENGTVMKIVDRTKEFTDTSGHWAKDSIDFVTSHELYAGTSETTFSPDAGMTRGMLAVVLHNLESNPDSTVGTTFKDVKDGAWCASAIRWAAERGIVSGYGNGQFGPNDQINREQLAVMLYRYAGTPANNGTVLNFRDADKVSAYAQEAMCWAVENGIISGTENRSLNPKGTATRAQVATMLMRFMENVG